MTLSPIGTSRLALNDRERREGIGGGRTSRDDFETLRTFTPYLVCIQRKILLVRINFRRYNSLKITTGTLLRLQ